MAGIALGNMSTSNGKTTITGGSSKLDTDALIKGLAEAKRLPAVKLEDTIKKNTTKIDALSEYKSLLDKLQKASNFLRNVPGVSNADSNVFAYSKGTVVSNTGVSGSTYLSTTVAAGTSPGSYELTVDQLATRQTYVTNTISVADTNTSVVDGGGAFNSGTMLLGTNSTPITLNAGDNLTDIMTKINAVKSTSGVEANIVKVSDGNYRLTMKSTSTGAAQNFDFDAMNPGMLNVGFYSKIDAVDALVTLDGTQVSRTSNTVTDLISGVTLNLTQQTPPGTTLTMSVTQDTSLAKDAIQNFVDAYNNIRAFAAKQSQTDDQGNLLDTAVLSSDPAMRTVNNAMASQINSVVNGLSGTINSLSSIGITLTDYAGDEETPLTRNILKLDETALDAALSSDFDAVRKVFEFNAVSDNADMLVFRHAKNTNVTSIQFNIDKANGVYTATYDDGSGPLTVNLTATDLGVGGGVSLAGPAGSAIEGLQVIFGSDDPAVVNMTLSQGIGDKLYNTLTDALDSTNGTVIQQMQSFTDRNTRMQTDIAKIDEQIVKYRETLTTKFSKLESAIAAVNNILTLLEAQADARNNA